MLSFDANSHQFNFRVAGIVSHGGRTLIHRDVADAFWTLPGGRVEAGEDAATALVREFAEELEVDVTVDSLAVVLENFFASHNKPFHELALYFRVSLPAGSNLLEQGGRFQGKESKLEFVWAEHSQLDAYCLLPNFLPAYLAREDEGIQHITHRDAHVD